METFLYLITYELEKADHKKDKNIREALGLNFEYKEYLNNVFIAKSNLTASLIYDILSQCVDDNVDRLLITKITTGIKQHCAWTKYHDERENWLLEALM